MVRDRAQPLAMTGRECRSERLYGRWRNGPTKQTGQPGRFELTGRIRQASTARRCVNV